MIRYEYKVLPAPSRGQRGKGVKGSDGRFANALETLINQMGSDGWEYQRAETLPSEERVGIASKTTVFRNVLVFRRSIETDVEAFEPNLLDAPNEEPEFDSEDTETDDPPSDPEQPSDPDAPVQNEDPDDYRA
ncbi:DUF4177 domain-containing protein [Planktotalea sp.]|uniref:DUF4177 domain-containing protein n=1 Tax=Planktotalea sp. TaxID=2029877 RepID=UPI0025E66650|nr:DUF4177 domain-containing protein [Planktotalea sp.]